MHHCIDAMHIEKNVYDSVLGLLFNMADNTKDGYNSRMDLRKMGIRKKLWSYDVETELADNVVKTKMSMAPACYTLSKEETRRSFKCLELSRLRLATALTYRGILTSRIQD